MVIKLDLQSDGGELPVLGQCSKTQKRIGGVGEAQALLLFLDRLQFILVEHNSKYSNASTPTSTATINQFPGMDTPVSGFELNHNVGTLHSPIPQRNPTSQCRVLNPSDSSPSFGDYGLERLTFSSLLLDCKSMEESGSLRRGEEQG
ncbi:hypothetical protein Droror1_Dr00008083 [Drosera rotundifolia]